MPGEQWRARRLSRPIREDVPIEDDETNIAKAERTHEGFRVLREKIAELQTDVLIVFSDDQLECFDFNNYPAFAVFVGEEFQKSPRRRSGGEDGDAQMGRHVEPGYRFKGAPDLGVSVLRGLMQRGFDPAFCMDMPKPDRGLAGGVIRSCEELTDWQMPVVPVMMNLYFAPQPTGMRCYQFGKAVREIIEEYPEDIRVGVVGSGGLWHTPQAKGAWLNTEFDLKTLEHLKTGDIKGMAEHFDSYVIPDDDTSQFIGERGRNVTGMPGFGGPQGGTRETCAWITAAGVTDGRPHVIVDYIDAYASPVGNAFAYCEDV
jgi:3-O-methylgallate 3,4-dioxygenase